MAVRSEALCVYGKCPTCREWRAVTHGSCIAHRVPGGKGIVILCKGSGQIPSEIKREIPQKRQRYTKEKTHDSNGFCRDCGRHSRRKHKDDCSWSEEV